MGWQFMKKFMTGHEVQQEEKQSPAPGDEELQAPIHAGGWSVADQLERSFARRTYRSW